MHRHWQVSEGGAVQPRWSSTGREIYYRGGLHMMAVAVDSGVIQITAAPHPTAL